MAAIERLLAALGRWASRGAGFAGGLVAAAPAAAVDVPPERAEAMLHLYDGGGVRAAGPALLVRKNLADRISASASYYVDAVSNASIDVVTTASPFRETRQEVGLGLDYAVRDSMLSVSLSNSREPDYTASGIGLDVTQEVFGGMTSVRLGFTRGSDDVGKKDEPGFTDKARHWQYRLGVTQVLTPRWLAGVNLEVVADDGFLGSPYRAARVFGATVPERVPRTRTSRALQLRALGNLGEGSAAESTAVRADYRYFWDTWGIKAHTVELGASRYFDGTAWLADGFLRVYSQGAAVFYSDNAQAETTYLSRNRQLSDFRSFGVGGKVSRNLPYFDAKYDVKLTGSYEFKRFDFGDFTDIRTGRPYAHNAHVLQIHVSAAF